MSARLAILALLAAGATGCSQSAGDFLTPPTTPIVWPAAPDSPRLRFLGELRGSEDIGAAKTFGERLDEFFHGPKAPVQLVRPHAVAVHADVRRKQGAPANRVYAPGSRLWASRWVAMGRSSQMTNQRR